ncbi:MAG TPA: DUF3618 domain-containing protein [Acidimicrobiales bacterium]|nr:DUF3618 domain-containing protein [Acidimicrobiales bacterium]
MAEDPGAIREEIAETRQELADTIAKLGEKADVKAQAGAKADELKATAVSTASEIGAKLDAAVPDQARPAVDAAKARVGPAVQAGADAVQRDPKRAAAIAAGVLVTLSVLRRLRRRARRR